MKKIIYYLSIFSLLILITGCTHKINNEKTTDNLGLVSYEDDLTEISFLYPKEWGEPKRKEHTTNLEKIDSDPILSVYKNTDFVHYPALSKYAIYFSDSTEDHRICPSDFRDIDEHYKKMGCSVWVTIIPYDENHYLKSNCYEGSCDSLINLLEEKENTEKKSNFKIDNTFAIKTDKHNFLNYFSREITIFKNNKKIIISLNIPILSNIKDSPETYNKEIGIDKILSKHENLLEKNHYQSIIEKFDNFVENFKIK